MKKISMNHSSLGMLSMVFGSILAVDARAIQFDFGSAPSPVESCYTPVTASSRYSVSAGFGWTDDSVLMDWDRGANGRVDTKVTQDFNYVCGANRGTFLVDVPNGRYKISATLGDPGPYFHDFMGIYLQDEQVDLVTTGPSEIVTKYYIADVANNQLKFSIKDQGGGDPCAVVEAMSIDPFRFKFDFGTSSSPVEATSTPVNAASRYSIGVGFGWTADSPIMEWDRGILIKSETSLTQDFNYVCGAGRGTFLIDLPDGGYNVLVTAGDLGPYSHDNVGVWFQDVQVDTVNTAANQVVTKIYQVNVTGGQLKFAIQDMGGQDSCAVIEGLEIVAPTKFQTMSNAPMSVSKLNSQYRTPALKTAQYYMGYNGNSCIVYGTPSAASISGALPQKAAQ